MIYKTPSLFKSGLRIGVLGGGQLGLMFSQAAISYGLEISILDPDPNASCRNISKGFVVGSFLDSETVYQFGKNLDLITIEIENVNIEALLALEKLGVQVFPQPHLIQLIQDKGLQKQFFLDQGIPTAPFRYINSKSQLGEFLNHLPAMLKLRKGGYDGRGVQLVYDEKTLIEIIKGNFPDSPSILEDLADFDKEISVMVARNRNGEIKSYDPVEMEFNPKMNLVEFLIAPARISKETSQEAKYLAENIIEKLGLVGILAVEMFLLKNGDLWVNEIAPRPHNSGHHSIEACTTSQFDQHLRAILNLPLGSSKTKIPSVMVNLLGSPGYSGIAKYIGMEEILGEEGAYLHLYAKVQTRPYRKMGHITMVNKNLNLAIEKAKKIQNLFKIIA
jgi:5-(carboxyamino)imidazole ribonucleotide synthase